MVKSDVNDVRWRIIRVSAIVPKSSGSSGKKGLDGMISDRAIGGEILIYLLGWCCVVMVGMLV